MTKEMQKVSCITSEGWTIKGYGTLDSTTQIMHGKSERRVLWVDPHQPTKELEWSVQYLFHIVDQNDEGYITQTKLEQAFVHWGLPKEDAALFTKECDFQGDGVIKFRSFLNLFHRKEKQIKTLFREIDIKNTGAFTSTELGEALHRGNVAISHKEHETLLKRIDRDGSGLITFDKWRDFLLLCPVSTDLATVYTFYRRLVQSDHETATLTPATNQRQPWKYFMAGAVAGATSRTGTAPLDRLKVLLQVQTGPTKHVTGMREGLRAIYLDGGITAFWRGNGVNILKIVPESAAKFYTYEQTKQYVCSDPRDMGVHHRLIAGGMAGLVSQFAIYPMELIKTRLITQSIPRGLVATFRDIWYKEGPLTFYRGLTTALLGIVPYAAIDLTIFETLKLSYMHFFEVDTPSALAMLACGTISSTIGSTTVYPLALIRTKIQAQQCSGDTKAYSGMRGVIRETMAKDGIRGFYKGMYPNLVK
eukprot:Ihof_evm8s151 gene=Ihof_evmTU8s151